MLPTYIVQPHRAGGYALSGPLLPFVMRFMDDAHAADYAHHKCRDTGGRVLVLDGQGRWQFTEHAQATDCGLRLLNEFRAGAKRGGGGRAHALTRRLATTKKCARCPVKFPECTGKLRGGTRDAQD